MTAGEPFPGSVNLKGVAVLTTKLIRFVYLGKIYIQEPCAHPLWRHIRKGRIVEEGKSRSKFKLALCLLICEVFKCWAGGIERFECLTGSLKCHCPEIDRCMYQHAPIEIKRFKMSYVSFEYCSYLICVAFQKFSGLDINTCSSLVQKWS